MPGFTEEISVEGMHGSAVAQVSPDGRQLSVLLTDAVITDRIDSENRFAASRWTISVSLDRPPISPIACKIHVRIGSAGFSADGFCVAEVEALGKRVRVAPDVGLDQQGLEPIDPIEISWVVPSGESRIAVSILVLANAGSGENAEALIALDSVDLELR